MVLESCAGLFDVVAVISGWPEAAVLMVIRFLPNGVTRVESWDEVPDTIAAVMAIAPGAEELPVPVPVHFVDCARASGGELEATGGSYRPLGDDVAEVVLW